MPHVSIEVLVEDLTRVFVDAGYTERSVKAKQYTWNTIRYLHKKNGLDQYDQVVVDLFVKEANSKFQNHSIGRIRYRHLLKCAEYLADYHEQGQCNIGARRIDSGLNEFYQSVIDLIMDHPEWNEKTKKSVRQGTMPFLKWLQQNSIATFEALSADTVRNYFIEYAGKTSINSLDAIQRLLRKCFAYLYSIHVVQEDYHEVLSFPTPVEHKIKKPVPHEEIAMVLSSIDRSTIKGKRDYAIILTAVVLGLRGIDVAELTFDEIDWINGELHILQSKTDRIIALPLTRDVGLAIQDYILHGRPDCDDPHIFLTLKRPLRGIGRTSPYQVFNGYRISLGLPKTHFHGLRRGVATGMVMDGVPVTTIAQVLGHSSVEPTKQYISLDSLHLRECALDLHELKSDEGGDLS